MKNLYKISKISNILHYFTNIPRNLSILRLRFQRKNTGSASIARNEVTKQSNKAAVSLPCSLETSLRMTRQSCWCTHAFGRRSTVQNRAILRYALFFFSQQFNLQIKFNPRKVTILLRKISSNGTKLLFKDVHQLQDSARNLGVLPDKTNSVD